MAIYRRLSLNSEIFEPKNDIYWVFKSTQFNLKKKVIDTTNYIIIPFILLVGFIKDNVISLYVFTIYVLSTLGAVLKMSQRNFSATTVLAVLASKYVFVL